MISTTSHICTVTVSIELVGRQAIQSYIPHHIKKQRKQSTKIVIMNTKIFLFFPLICMVASNPQRGSRSSITVEGKQVDLLLNFPEGIDGAPQSPAEFCDGYSCTGLEYKLPIQLKGKDVFIGQCQSNFPEFRDEEFFCFVNEDSSCNKKPSTAFPGKFVSSEPCRTPSAPKRRGLGDNILAALTTVWNWLSNL